MAIQYKGLTAALIDIVAVEEAEGLLQWLLTNPDGAVDLSGCKHLHAAVLQVLMAGQPKVNAWPEDEGLAVWLKEAIKTR